MSSQIKITAQRESRSPEISAGDRKWKLQIEIIETL